MLCNWKFPVHQITMLFSLSKGHPFIVYGYSPAIWTTFVGGLLVVTPLMCIPVFIFVSMCKVSEFTCSNIISTTNLLWLITFWLYFPPDKQDGQNMTTPSSDLRQAQPHKPILTLCKCVIFKAQVQPKRGENEHEKMMMEEARRVWSLTSPDSNRITTNYAA